MRQGGSSLRGPTVVAAGGTISVHAAAGGETVEVTVPGVLRTEHSLDADGNANIPVPNVPPGTIVLVRVGQGLRARSIAIEVVAPGP